MWSSSSASDSSEHSDSSSKKSRGGGTYSWIGCELSLRQWSLGISATRADRALRLEFKLVRPPQVPGRHLEEGKGTLHNHPGALPTPTRRNASTLPPVRPRR